MRKLDELREVLPAGRGTLSEREAVEGVDLVVVVALAQDLGKAVRLPSLSRKGGQAYSFTGAGNRGLK